MAVAGNDASRTLTIDNINQDAALAASARTASFDLAAKQHVTDSERKESSAASTRTFADDSSEQAAQAAIAIAQLEATHQKALHAATLTYVQAVAPEDKVYDDKSVLESANDAADAEKEYSIDMLNADTDYSNAAIQASAGLSGAVGDSYEDYYNDDIDAAQLETNINDAVDAYNTAMSTATDDYNAAGAAATDAVRIARQGLFKRWAEHQAKNQAIQNQAKASHDRVNEVQQLGVGQRNLAQAILSATTALANSRKDALDLFSTTVNNLDTPAATSRTTTDNQYRSGSTSAANSFDRRTYLADATKREADVAAQGVYEGDWYTAYKQVMVQGLQAMRFDFIMHQHSLATAEANLAAALTTASGNRNVADEDAERTFQANRNQAQRIRQIDTETAYGTYLGNTVPVENSRWQNATQLPGDYQYKVAQAEATKLFDVAEAAKTHNMDLADDDPADAYDDDGNPIVSVAEKAYRKAMADAEFSYQDTISRELQGLQADDVSAKQSYTRDTANHNSTFNTVIAGFGLTYQNTIADSERTRAVAAALADNNYLNSQSANQAARRMTLASRVAAITNGEASAKLTAYYYIDQEYNLPYTKYLYVMWRLR